MHRNILIAYMTLKQEIFGMRFDEDIDLHMKKRLTKEEYAEYRKVSKEVR